MANTLFQDAVMAAMVEGIKPHDEDMARATKSTVRGLDLKNAKEGLAVINDQADSYEARCNRMKERKVKETSKQWIRAESHHERGADIIFKLMEGAI